MPFGEIVIGSPGSGKSTYAYGKYQLLTALERPIAIVNLDPANDALPYPCAIDISTLISLDDVMTSYGLGPNGAMLYCMEYLEANLDWLEAELAKLDDGTWVVFDIAGQVELSTNHGSLKRIVERLQKLDYRLAAVHLCDAHYVTDAAKYISVLLLSLRTMLQLELPHINVLSKVDLITQYGDLAFNLDYYTEVQDLSYLSYELDRDPHSAKFADLNRAICDLVEDFGLVGFETLAVEDKTSMLRLLRVIDKATGYIFAPPKRDSTGENSEVPAPATSSKQRTTSAPNADALFSSAMSSMPGPGDVRDVQERWVDAREEWDEWERNEWKWEGEIVRRRKEMAEGNVKLGSGTGEPVGRLEVGDEGIGTVRERRAT